jgi:hypothetical protein
MTTAGTVVASIPAGAATDADANGNTASTSTDNSVTWNSTSPSVTVNQAASQADPTNTSPISFTVVFSEPVTGFTGADVTISGTAGGTKAVNVSGSGPTYTVAVSGMTTAGTVVASIPAGAATDADANGNTASTSTDNSVTWNPVVPPSGWTHVGTGPLAATFGSSSTSTSVGYPAGIAAGDLLLLGCQGRHNSMDWSAPGFGSLIRTTLTSGLRFEVLSAWAAGGESGSLTVTSTIGMNGWSCELSAFRGGLGAGSPLAAAPVAVAGKGSTMTAPSVTTATGGALVTRWFASMDDNNHGNPSAGSLAFGGTAYHTTVGVDHAASMAYLVQASAGASGTATMAQQANAADGWTAVTIVFTPGSGG